MTRVPNNSDKNNFDIINKIYTDYMFFEFLLITEHQALVDALSINVM